MLTRAEIEERLGKYQSIEGMAIVVSAGMYREALETAQQLGEWLEWQDRACFKTRCHDCPTKFPNGCVDDWETCEVESAKARAWLEGSK